MIVEWCQSRHFANSGGRCMHEDGHDGPHQNRIRGVLYEWTAESEDVRKKTWRRTA